MNDQSFIQPQQQGLSGTTVVASGDSRTPNPNKVLLQAGLNPGRIVQVVDLGTHMESFNNAPEEPKRKIRIAFEHSHLKQKYYIEDDVVKPCMTSKEVTFVFSERAWIKKLIDIVEGRILTIPEAKVYDLQKLLGAVVGVNILHKETKAKTHFYEKIESILPWNNETSRMPQNWSPEMDMHYFFIDMTQAGEVIGQNFTSNVFANLPWGVRSDLMKSHEAIAYKARGGMFADKKDNGGGSQAPVQQQTQEPAIQQQQSFAPAPVAPQQPAPIPNASVSNLPLSPDGQSVLEMITKSHTFEQFVNSGQGWDANKLVANGHARWVQVQQEIQAPVQQQQNFAPAPEVPQQPINQGQGFQQQPTQQGFKTESDDLPF